MDLNENLIPEGFPVKRDDVLIRYENPKVVLHKSISQKKPSKAPATGRNIPQPRGTSLELACCDFCPVDESSSSSLLNKFETEEVLNTILPPRIWKEDGKIWKQVVSSSPATRADVITLEDRLKVRLEENSALVNGICPIRDELYGQCLDELIRQMTINCTEKGLMLVRIRDEMRITINSYRALFESAAAFGLRRVLEAHEERSSHVKLYKQLVEERDGLVQEQNELKQKLADFGKEIKEQKEADEAKHRHEVEVLKRINAQIRQQLENIVTPSYMAHSSANQQARKSNAPRKSTKAQVPA